MKNSNAIAFAVVAAAWIAVAPAQTPAPTNGAAANPSSASSPDQRDVLRGGAKAQGSPTAPEGSAANASSASSPDQRAVTGGSRMASTHTKMASSSAHSFLQQAARGGMAEVKLAQLAAKKSQNDAVRKFAADMERDHGSANSELENIASRKHVSLASSLDSRQQAALNQLSGKSGNAFDVAYAELMVRAHKQAIALFKSGSGSQDSDVADFAKQTLPTLEEHLRMADKLASAVKVASADTSGTQRR